MASEASSTGQSSLFIQKYNEFADDLSGALPEYAPLIAASKALPEAEKRSRFHSEIEAIKELHRHSAVTAELIQMNPGRVLPGVVLVDSVWAALSDATKEAVWDHLRVISICMFLDEFGGDDSGNSGVEENAPPVWMEDALKEMKHKFESTDFSALMSKFASFFQTSASSAGDEKDAGGAAASGAAASASGIPNADAMFGAGFPKMPERFLKGHMAKLAQEIVKEIKPEDLGITKEMIGECEKDPSRAFNILLSSFMGDPGIIQRTIARIGNRLQQKVASGAIRPMEIAREAEELMKEFVENKPFVEMMESIKTAFGFEDMEMARSVGKEGSARLSIARERLRKKLEQKRKK